MKQTLADNKDREYTSYSSVLKVLVSDNSEKCKKPEEGTEIQESQAGEQRNF